MNFKKLITNTLAIVGAVVIIDKIVNVISDKGTEVISKAMLDDDFTNNDSCDDSCQCSLFDDEDEETLHSTESEENTNNSDSSIIFPEIKKYEDKNQVFQYAIKTEASNSDTKEV